MKVVIFKGGLGNQLFQFALYSKLIEAGHRVRAINFCQKSHNGFEVTKYFEVKVKFCHAFYVWLFFKFCSLPKAIKHHFIIDEKNYHVDALSLYFNDYWQDLKFFPSKCCLRFKSFSLNDMNRQTLNLIESTNSVSIHIRRGDYLEGGCSDVFVNLSETDYYEKAIKLICSDVTNATFFVFSNDIEWCKLNLNVGNAHYIDWNKGKDSIFDMYLMSKCHYNIIANSTFSYWAAYLNKTPKRVIYPRNWFKNQMIDIFPRGWKEL